MASAVELQAFVTIGHFLFFLTLIGTLVGLWIAINYFDDKQSATPALANVMPVTTATPRHHAHDTPHHAADRVAAEHAVHTHEHASVKR